MTSQTELIRRELLEKNSEFRRLHHEHAHYAEQLELLLHKPQPTAEEQLDIARLKKLKLQAKDRMEELVRGYRREEAEAVQAT